MFPIRFCFTDKIPILFPAVWLLVFIISRLPFTQERIELMMLHDLAGHPVVLPTLVGSAVLIPELFILLTRFTRSSTTVAGDNYSLLSILGTTFVSICLASPFVFFPLVPELHFKLGLPGIIGVLLLLITGLTLRWWSIYTLGVFFTVNVAAHEDHRLITAGPYRLLRHPSYTGVLLTVLAFALSCQHFLSLIIIMIPTTLAFIYRITIEERVLIKTLGEDYQHYQKKTYALLPYVY